MSDRLPLSAGQEQLWFLDELSPGDPTYTVCQAYRVRGRLDVPALRASLTAAVERHEQLRVRFGAVDGVPFQQVRPAPDVPMPVIDLGVVDRPAPDVGPALDTALRQEAETPFDLRADAPFRARLLRLAEDDHVVVLSFHHLVVDGFSCGLLGAEISRHYAAIVAGGAPPAPGRPGRYADFVHRQRADGDRLAEDLAHWEQTLRGVPYPELPADRTRPAVATHRGDRVTLAVPPDLVLAARAAGREHGVSLLMLLTAAVTAVLHRYTGQDDLPVGTSVLGRTDPDDETVVGLFVNLLVLRVRLDGDPTLAEHLERVREVTLDAYDHQAAPFGAVVERVRPVRDAGRNPLFACCIQLLGGSTSGDGLHLAGTDTTALPVPATRSRFDLSLNAVESAGGLRLDAEYATDLFDRWRVAAFLRHVVTAVRALCDEPSVPLSRMRLLSDEERDGLLALGRGPASGTRAEPVHHVVSRTAEAAPGAVAAVCGDRSITYRELEERSDALARHLRRNGVAHGQIVGLALRRSLEVLVAMLATVKAGAAYVVLDPDHPADRLAYQLADTAAPVVLTTADVAPRVPVPDGVRVVRLDEELPDPGDPAPSGPGEGDPTTADSPMYVIYTSGSTGRPKGVIVEHRALLSFTVAYRRAFDLGPGDRMLQFSALTFDMSQGEIFAGLCAGATLVLVPYGVSTPEDLETLVRDQEITFVSLSPAMLALVAPGPYPALRKIQSGGDVLPAEVVARWWAPDRLMINMYGPTEATVACTGSVLRAGTGRSGAPPIGTPMVDRQMYVVDRHDELVPSGVPGELLIGGDEGLARGYLNLPELTAERFVPDPFRPGLRVYRSGDLVRWTVDGELEFLGRLDSQVKVNGIRIELEEIESVLLRHPAVAMAAVAVRPDVRGEKRLVGYVAPAGRDGPAPDELRRHAAGQLPDSMVPSVWVTLPALPLTTARKVDRTALPDPGPAWSGDPNGPVPPATATEHAVAEILAEVLAVPTVSVTSGFFDLGGTSMDAMRVVSRINKRFGTRMNVRSLYGNASARAIAADVDTVAQAADVDTVARAARAAGGSGAADGARRAARTGAGTR